MKERSSSDLLDRAFRQVVFTERDLAEAAGFSPDSLSSWRVGRRVPSRDTLYAFADAIARQGEVLRRVAQEIREEADRAGAGEP